MQYIAWTKKEGKPLFDYPVSREPLTTLLNRVANEAAKQKDKQTSVYIQQFDSESDEEQFAYFRIFQGERLLFAWDGTCFRGQAAEKMPQHWVEQNADLEKQSKLLKPNQTLRVWQQEERVCLFNEKVFFTGTIGTNMEGWELHILIERLA